MRSEKELLEKKREIESSLWILMKKRKETNWWSRSKSDDIQIEFHKNNLAFIYWTLGLEWKEGSYL